MAADAFASFEGLYADVAAQESAFERARNELQEMRQVVRRTQSAINELQGELEMLCDSNEQIHWGLVAFGGYSQFHEMNPGQRQHMYALERANLVAGRAMGMQRYVQTIREANRGVVHGGQDTDDVGMYVEGGESEGEPTNDSKESKTHGAVEEERTPGPAFAKKGWKSVQLDLDVMKEFEAQGGLFIEEADPDEIGVEYSSMAKLPAKKKRKKVKTSGQGEEDLSKENERLRKELEELRGKTQVQEEDHGAELASSELSDWAQFELHPKLMVGLARQEFRSPTPVQVPVTIELCFLRFWLHLMSNRDVSKWFEKAMVTEVQTACG
eukprot:s3117_g4.t1